MRLKGPLEQLMVMVEPSLHHKYAIYDIKGVPLLYVKIKKSLYGILKRTLMLYTKLRGELESIGFETNLYDPCFSNNNINSTQMISTWHVDDLKLSHKDDFDITNFGVWLEGI